jgi:hypothetical protein
VAVAARVETAVTADEHLAVQQAAHDLHTETTREVVVTRSRGSQPRGPGAFPQGAHRARRRQPHEVLE